MAKRKATAKELEARAESNDYKRGVHREKDSTQDNGKYNIYPCGNAVLNHQAVDTEIVVVRPVEWFVQCTPRQRVEIEALLLVDPVRLVRLVHVLLALVPSSCPVASWYSFRKPKLADPVAIPIHLTHEYLA
jgi:hypothetical protein